MSHNAKKDTRKGSHKCIIASCRCGYRNCPKDSRVSLFRFPSNKFLFNKWIESCNLDVNMIRTTSRICERHFQAKWLGKFRLKSRAVPTENLSLLIPMEEGVCDENTFPDHTVDNTPTEKSKSIELSDMDNSSTISEEFELESDIEESNSVELSDMDNSNTISEEFKQESDTETYEEDPLQNDECSDFEFRDSYPIKTLSDNQKDNRNVGYKCILSSCLRGYKNSPKDSPVRLFRFTSDKLLFNKWIKACKLYRKMVNKSSRICERHFEASAFGKHGLNSTAVPTLNLPDNTMLTSLNETTGDENTFSGSTVDNKQTEKRIQLKVIKLSDLQNNNSNGIEPESETETPDKDQVETNESSDLELCENEQKKESSANQKDKRKGSVKCIISSCVWAYRNSPKDSPVRLFRFPSDLLFFDKWVEVCNLDGNFNVRTARICERHFEDKYLGNIRLKPDAIPTLNLSNNTLLNPMNERTCDENKLSGKTEGEKQADLPNKNSDELEQESETEEDPFEDIESSDLELCETNKKVSRKSGHKCIISSCDSGYRNSSPDLPVRLFAFPSDLLFFDKWLEACSLDRNMVKRTSRICERHFEVEWFGKLRLKSKAIPTLNLPDNTRLTPSNASIYDDNLVSGNSVDNEPTDMNHTKSKRIKLIENNTISTQMPDKDPLEDNEPIETKCCTNCIEKEQNESYYRKKCFELLEERQKKEQDFDKLKKRYKNFKRVVSRNNSRYRIRAMSNQNVLPLISSMSHVSTEAKTICTMLLKKTATFTPAEKVIAQNINFYSSATYKYLRDVLHLNLPTERTLERWAVRFGQGFSPDLLGTQQPNTSNNSSP